MSGLIAICAWREYVFALGRALAFLEGLDQWLSSVLVGTRAKASCAVERVEESIRLGNMPMHTQSANGKNRCH